MIVQNVPNDKVGIRDNKIVSFRSPQKLTYILKFSHNENLFDQIAFTPSLANDNDFSFDAQINLSGNPITKIEVIGPPETLHSEFSIHCRVIE